MKWEKDQIFRSELKCKHTEKAMESKKEFKQSHFFYDRSDCRRLKILLRWHDFQCSQIRVGCKLKNQKVPF